MLLKNVIKEYFEKLWEAAKKERRSEILNLLEEHPKGKPVFLDCGCSSGELTRVFARKLKTNKIHAIEINRKSAIGTKKRGIKIKTSDLNVAFPFKDEIFNVVTADQVIEHLWDLDNFVSEIKRVLKPGGYAVISTENLASWHNLAALFFGLQPFSGPTPSTKHTSLGLDHIKVLTLPALVSLFETYGFKIEKIKASGYLPFPQFVAKFLAKLDKKHALFIIIKARKFS